MKQTPLCDALRSFAAEEPLRMHMPGHKGRALPLPELSPAAPIDFTELDPTGDLFSPGGPIEEAEQLWAQLLGVESCLFLTGGSTQGILASYALCCQPGDTVLMDRGCHRSSFNALALLDLHPRFLPRPWLPGPAVTGPITAQAVEAALSADPSITAVSLTSPTYYGVLSPLEEIAQVVHAHGAQLIVDAAHGAHLPFLGDRSLACADAAVVSAHKTLPAPGQSALLFSASHGLADLRAAASLFGTSSPSYPMMAALDAVRAWMEEEGRAELQETVRQVSRLRGCFPALTPASAPLDPCRLVLCCSDGFEAQRLLEEQGVYPEMADSGHVVCICTSADRGGDFDRLAQVWAQVLHRLPPADSAPLLPPPPEGVPVLSPRAARFAPQESVPLRSAVGRVAAEQVAPYPPGIPVVAPGEQITKKTIAYLTQIGYNMEKDMKVIRL